MFVNPTVPQTDEVVRWESPHEFHPVIQQLRERREAILDGTITGTEWGVVQEHVPTHPMTGAAVLNEAAYLCHKADQVEIEARGATLFARWLTEEEYTAMVMDELAGDAANTEKTEGSAETL